MFLRVLSLFILFQLKLLFSLNASDEFCVESQDIDGQINIRVPQDMIKTNLKPVVLKPIPSKPTALHIIYQKEKEKLDKLSKPNNKPRRSINKEQLRSIVSPLPDAKINEYSNIRNLDMADSSGNIILYSTLADKFSVESYGELNLTLQNGSTVKLKNEEVTLKAGDVINIVGKNNFIEVPNIFNIAGNLLFDIDSQLTIKLTTDDAQVIFDDGTLLDLESNTEFKITGDGFVSFGDDSIINLKGNISYPTLYPSFIIDSFATVSPADSCTLNIKGIGKIIVQDGGTIDVRGYESYKHLNVGLNSTDDIDFYIKGKGMIRLEGGQIPYRTSGYSYTPPEGYYGSLSFGKGQFSITLKQGGILYVGEGGWLEFGSILAEPTSLGYLKKLDFGPDGNFYLNDGGILSFANNNFMNNIEQTTIWISDDAKILGDGAGFVEYITKAPRTGFNYQGFVGTFQSQNFAFKNISGLIPKDIAKKLVNQNTSLVTAIFYTDNNGLNKIRLKNGAVISFVVGDTIIGENSSGEVLARSSAGRNVIYKLNGTRV